MKFLKLTTLSLTALFTGATSALAQSADWVQPATTLIETLQSGLVTVGAILVGLCIVGIGMYQAFTGHLHVGRLVGLIFGGILIAAGPAIMTALLGSVG